MTIEFDDDEIRLLYNVLLEQAEEHLSYANNSELADTSSRHGSRATQALTLA
jgi:hypothetical protein